MSLPFDLTAEKRLLDDAKARIGIAEAWRALGLPDAPDGRSRKLRSPLRPDRHAGSFVLTPDGRRFIDFARDDHRGDVLTFIRLALGCDFAEAKSRLLAWAGLVAASSLPQRPAAPRRDTRHAGEPLVLPGLRAPTDHELAGYLARRGFPADALPALRELHRDGLLFARDTLDAGLPVTALVFTDAARRAASLRRADNHPWRWNNAKAFAARGSQTTWPVGAATLRDPARAGRPVLLVEGFPDFLAAAILLRREACPHPGYTGAIPVARLSASGTLHPDSLPLFRGRRVLILPHDDAPGRAAAARDIATLRSVGVFPEILPLRAAFPALPADAKDLADTLRLLRESSGKFPAVTTPTPDA